MTDIDPLDALRSVPVDDVVEPRPEFVRRLRRRLADALGNPAEVPLDDTRSDDTRSVGTRSVDTRSVGAGSISAGLPTITDLPTIDLPERSPAMSTSNTAPAAPAGTAPTLVPYLAVQDAPSAIAFYEEVFDAEVTLRFDGDDGRIGHADLLIGPARLFLSDEYPEIGVLGPRTLGGTPVTLHLEVDDADAVVARAAAAGATVERSPEDMAYGHRQGVLLDPFGHRWMLSQRLESVGAEELATRMAEDGYRLSGSWVDAADDAASPGATAGDRATVVARNGRIWPAIAAADAPALIRTAVEVFGFTEQLVVPGDGDGVVAHSQLAWPEGGVVQVSTAHRDGNVFSEQAIGTASIYVVTDDPLAVHQRCVAAGLEIVREPESPDYDPGGSGFGLRDPEGNLWSFGTYAGQ